MISDRAYKLSLPRTVPRDGGDPRYYHDAAAGLHYNNHHVMATPMVGQRVAPAFGVPGDPSAIEAMVLTRAARRARRAVSDHRAHESPNKAGSSPPRLERAPAEQQQPAATPVPSFGMAAAMQHRDPVSTVQYVAQLEHNLGALEAEHTRLCRVMLRHVSRNTVAELELEEAEERVDIVNAALASQQRISSFICREMAEVAMTMSARANMAHIALEADRPTKSLANLLRDVEMAQMTLSNMLQESRRESATAIGRTSSALDACVRAAEDLRADADRFVRTTTEENQQTRNAVARNTTSCVDAVQQSESALSLRLQALLQASSVTSDAHMTNVAAAIGALHNDVRSAAREACTAQVLTSEVQALGQQMSAMAQRVSQALDLHRQVGGSDGAVSANAQHHLAIDRRNSTIASTTLLASCTTTHFQGLLDGFMRASATKGTIAADAFVKLRTTAAHLPIAAASSTPNGGRGQRGGSRGEGDEAMVGRSVASQTVTPHVVSREVSAACSSGPAATQTDAPPKAATAAVQVDLDPPFAAAYPVITQQPLTFISQGTPQVPPLHPLAFSGGSSASFDIPHFNFNAGGVGASFGVVSAPTVPPSPVTDSGPNSLVSRPHPNAPLPSSVSGLRSTTSPQAKPKPTPSDSLLAPLAMPASKTSPNLSSQTRAAAPAAIKRKPISKKAMAPAASSSDTEDMNVSLNDTTSSDDGDAPSKAAAAHFAAAAASRKSLAAAPTTASPSTKPPLHDSGGATGSGAAAATTPQFHSSVPLISINRDPHSGSSADHTPTPTSRGQNITGSNNTTSAANPGGGTVATTPALSSNPDLGAFILPPSGDYFGGSMTMEPPDFATLRVDVPAATSASGRPLKKASSFDSMSPSGSFRSPRNRTVVFLGDDGGGLSPSPRASLTTYPSDALPTSHGGGGAGRATRESTSPQNRQAQQTQFTAAAAAAAGAASSSSTRAPSPRGPAPAWLQKGPGSKSGPPAPLPSSNSNSSGGGALSPITVSSPTVASAVVAPTAMVLSTERAGSSGSAAASGGGGAGGGAAAAITASSAVPVKKKGLPALGASSSSSPGTGTSSQARPTSSGSVVAKPSVIQSSPSLASVNKVHSYSDFDD